MSARASNPMQRILIVHNEYRDPGGEDIVVAQEVDLLRSKGHTVIEYRRSNREISDGNGGLLLARRLLWSEDAHADLARLVRDTRPQVAHFHNTFAVISPAAYYAVRRAGVPVVQTLHNYRLLCARADFHRAGRVCEDCLGRALPWPAVIHGCYQDSKLNTAGVVALHTFHRLLGTWNREVDCYIALTQFARNKFIAGGLPAERIAVVPNCVAPDPGPRAHNGGYALYAGRFEPESRVKTLLHAWQHLPSVPLKIAGGGAGEESMMREARRIGVQHTEFLGWQPRETVLEIMKEASFLVVSSEWYETFSLVIAEAFACGVPVICPRLGAMQERVDDGRTGLHFQSGNAEDLAAKVQWAWAHPAEMDAMGRNARGVYESRYTPEQHYRNLMQVFERAAAQARSVA
jgi:glycosyltransferase involved in cell wall biosynthesis